MVYTGERNMQFLMIPENLFSDERYAGLCIEAKLLYALMLDRLSLSEKNGWRDERGVYVYFTRTEAAKLLRVSERSISRYLTELKKTELIKTKRQEVGSPLIIYPKKCQGE